MAIVIDAPNEFAIGTGYGFRLLVAQVKNSMVPYRQRRILVQGGIRGVLALRRTHHSASGNSGLFDRGQMHPKGVSSLALDYATLDAFDYFAIRFFEQTLVHGRCRTVHYFCKDLQFGQPGEQLLCLSNSSDPD